MSNPHGQAHHGLHARPLMANAGTSPHPAIATDQGSDLYYTRRAARIEATGGDAANIRVPVSQGKATSSPTKAERGVMIDAPEARQLYWVMIADAYLTGEKTMRELAIENGVSVFVVRDYVHSRRATFALDHKKRPLGTRRNRDHEPSLVQGAYGAGGSMTDDSVRRATLDLESAIVAGLKKRGLAPLPYRREEATA